MAGRGFLSSSHRMRRAALVLLVAAIFALGAVLALGRDTIARAGLWAASAAAGFSITCAESEGDVFDTLDCRGLTIADGGGPFLTARRAKIDWRPSRLFRGAVAITSVELEGAVFTRLPEDEGGEGGLPGVDIRAERIVLGDLDLRLGDAAPVCLRGQARVAAGPSGLDLATALARCGGEGTVRIAARYDAPAAHVALDGEIADDGALAAAILGVEGAGRTMLKLKGTGPLTRFAGTLDASAEGVGRTVMRLVAQTTALDGADRIAVDGSISLMPGVMPSWAPGMEGALAMRLVFPAAGGMKIEDARLAWGAAKANAVIAMAAGTGALAGEIKVELAGIPYFSTGSLAAALRGTRARPIASGTFGVDAVAIADAGAARAEGRFEITADRAAQSARLDLRGRATALTIPGGFAERDGGDAIFSATGTADFAQGMATLTGAAKTKALAFDVAMQVPFKEGSPPNGQASLATDDLASLTGGALEGPARAIVELDQVGAGGSYSGRAALDANMLDAEGAWRVSASGEIDAHLATTRTDGAVLGRLLGVSLTGSPVLRAAVEGPADAPRATLEADIPGLDAGGVAFSAIRLEAGADRHDGTWQGAARLTGTSAAGTLALAADLARDAAGRVRATLRKNSSWGRSGLAGSLAAPGPGGPYTGRLALTGRPLAPLAPLLGTDLDGAGEIALVLQASGGKQTAKLVMAVNDVAGASLLAHAKIDGEIVIAAAKLDASVTLKDGVNTLELEAAGTFGNETRISVRKLAGNWEGIAYRLDGTADIRAARGETVLSRATFDVAGSWLSLEGRRGQEALSVRLALEKLPARAVAGLFALGEAQGTIAGSAALDIAPSASHGKFDFAANGLAFEGRGRAATPADLALAGAWDGRILSVHGAIEGLDAEPARLEATLPLVKRAGAAGVALAERGAVSARFSGRMRAERLAAVLPLAEHRVEGVLAVDLGVSGDITAPKVSGAAKLADGRYESLETGTRLERLTATLEATADGAFVLDANATDGGSGTFALTGRAALGPRGLPVGRAALSFENAYLVRRDGIVARGRGEVEATRSAGAVTHVAGKATTSEVRIDLGKPLPHGVRELDVEEINLPERARGPKADGMHLRDLVRETTLDLAVEMPNRVYVEGRGLTSEWRGSLKVSGTLAEPIVDGGLSVVRGDAQLLGRNFLLDKGMVMPDAKADGGARVDITASHQASDMTVRAHVTGPVGAPELAWSSSPSFPRDEILGRLFFGKSSPKLSAFEALQLAEMSGRLGDLGGGGGVMAFARRVAGLDVLRVESPGGDSSEGPSVSIGKYVTREIYVGAKRGPAAASGEIEVEVRLTPHITVQAESGTDSQGEVGVSWQWDY